MDTWRSASGLRRDRSSFAPGLCRWTGASDLRCYPQRCAPLWTKKKRRHRHRPASTQPHPSRGRENLSMATIAFDPPPPVFPGRTGQRRAVSIPAPTTSVAQLESLQPSPATSVSTVPVPGIEHVLPLSGCRLTVLDLPDGSRVGRLAAADGRVAGRSSLRARVAGERLVRPKGPRWDVVGARVRCRGYARAAAGPFRQPAGPPDRPGRQRPLRPLGGRGRGLLPGCHHSQPVEHDHLPAALRVLTRRRRGCAASHEVPAGSAGHPGAGMTRI